LSAWLAAGSPPSGWLAPAYRRSLAEVPNFGHPVLIGRTVLAGIAGTDPATPLRSLRSRARPVFSVDVASPEILDDLDTAEDFERMRRDRSI
jgi:CTP:molybdopterin cytidylyltransferase MocA